METKSPILSLTIQGALITMLPMLGGYINLDFGDVQGLVESAVSFVGAGMVIWGRIRAVKKITLK